MYVLLFLDKRIVNGFEFHFFRSKIIFFTDDNNHKDEFFMAGTEKNSAIKVKLWNTL